MHKLDYINYVQSFQLLQTSRVLHPLAARALAVGLSEPVGACRSLSGHCRTTVGLSDCRTVKWVSDTVGHCRTRSDRLDVWLLSDAVGVVGHCRTVGLSDTVKRCRSWCRS